MNQRYRHQGLFAFEATTPPTPDEGQEFVIPEDLAEVADEDLDEENPESLVSRMIAAFDGLYEGSNGSTETTTTLDELATAIDSLRSEHTARDTARAEAKERADALHARIHGAAETPEDPDEPADPDAPPAPEAAVEEEKVAVMAAAAPVPSVTNPVKRQSINVPLSEIRKRAPAVEARPALAILAAADVPRYQAGHTFADLGELSNAFHERAKSTPVSMSGNTSGPKVATINLDFDNVVSANTSPQDLNRMFKEMTDPQALVAAGGWCSPSATSYDFFDISCEDGMIDIPTFGVDRGGLRLPTSPSMADVYTGVMDNTTNPWVWTESDDILTVTGTGVKPCVRVPCPTFTDVRLECYGICLTAGNLTDAAWPESIAHYLGLLRSAHYHAQNARYIAAMVAGSTPVASGGFFDAVGSIASDLPSAVGWAAVDFRARYGMCANDILEVVLPAWTDEVIRGDLSQRQGIDLDTMAVPDAVVRSFFDVRNVRTQFVNDWQIRSGNQPGGATPSQLYPTTVSFLLYPAGTWARGNGLTLDLGVTRDSTLNKENDHTAAWMEECHLIAKIGPASRLYTVGICAAGRSGQANITDCRTS